ncbi:MAG TPA: hypothetical protein VND93_01265, partial [Myxococcales bacterium]|nr:hypothetical protein [Myxococcales bacterium]
APGGAAEAPRPGFKFSLELPEDVRFKLADRKRDEAIEQLKEMIPRFDEGSKEKPDLLFQLSEFYWEKHRYLYAQEEKQHEQAVAAWEARKKQGAKEPEPKADHQASEQQRHPPTIHPPHGAPFALFSGWSPRGRCGSSASRSLGAGHPCLSVYW